MRWFDNIMALATFSALLEGGLAKESACSKDSWGGDEPRPDKCYGIALSDASDFGPYQAGALIGLLKH